MFSNMLAIKYSVEYYLHIAHKLWGIRKYHKYFVLLLLKYVILIKYFQEFIFSLSYMEDFLN